MDPLLLEFINQCYAKALANGLNDGLPTVIDYSDSEDLPVKIVVSFTEPTELLLPLNVIWIVADENNGDDYLSALIRTSKQTSANYAHSWAKAVSINEINGISQYYEGTDKFRYEAYQTLQNLQDVPNPFPNKYLSLTGNQSLTGPVFLRELSNSQSYGLTEAIPRKTLVDALNNQTQGFYAILIGLNNRMNTAEQRLNNHQQRIEALELGTGGGNGGAQLNGARFYIHMQGTADTEWIINHQLNTRNIIVQVWKDDSPNPEVPEQVTQSEVMVEEKTIFDENFIVVRFSVPTTGRVVISTFGLEP